MTTYSEAGVRKASREETAGEFALAVVLVYGDLTPVYALIFGFRTGTTAEQITVALVLVVVSRIATVVSCRRSAVWRSTAALTVAVGRG